MRYLIAFMLISSAAMADDLDALKERYYENRAGCREGQINGVGLSKDQSDQACAQLSKIASVLKKAGQCWDNGEVEWRACK